MKSIVYLCCPVQSEEGWAFLTAVTTFVKGDWDENTQRRLSPLDTAYWQLGVQRVLVLPDIVRYKRHVILQRHVDDVFLAIISDPVLAQESLANIRTHKAYQRHFQGARKYGLGPGRRLTNPESDFVATRHETEGFEAIVDPGAIQRAS